MASSRLEDLLDDMNQAIKAAEFSRLQTLIAEIEAVEELETCGYTKADLQRLRQKAQRNSQSALAAGRGVRAALQRIKDIRDTAYSLRTYDRWGKRSEVLDIGTVTRRL